MSDLDVVILDALSSIPTSQPASRTRRVIISKDGSVPGTVTSWTCPDGVTNIRGYLVGPGGSGSGTLSTTASWATGGGSGSVTPFERTVVPGTTYSFESPWGQSWTVSNLVSSSGTGYYNGTPGVQMLDATHAVAGFYNGTNFGLYYSTNSGQTWTISNIAATTSSVSGAYNVYPTFAALDTSGHVVASYYNGTSVVAYYSTNYGQTWTVSSLPTSSTQGQLNATCAVTALDAAGHAVIAFFSNNATNPYAIYYTSNYGQTWTASNLANATSFNYVNAIPAVAALDSSGHAVASFYNGTNTAIYYTSNYGQTWTATALTSTIGSGAWNATPVLEALDNSGHAVASFYNGSTYTVYYTSNYGQTWTASNLTGTLATSNRNGTPAIAAMGSSGRAVASFYNGTNYAIYYTSNYGQTWTATALTTTTGSTAIPTTPALASMDSAGHGLASFYNGTNTSIYYTADYGQTWTVSAGRVNAATLSNMNGFTTFSADGSGHGVMNFFNGTTYIIWFQDLNGFGGITYQAGGNATAAIQGSAGQPGGGDGGAYYGTSSGWGTSNFWVAPQQSIYGITRGGVGNKALAGTWIGEGGSGANPGGPAGIIIEWDEVAS